MENEKKFKTKTGFCHILPDKIILTRDGVIGDIAKVTIGNNITQPLLIYGGISVALIYFAYDSYQNGQITKSIFFGLIGSYLIYGVFASLNNSATPIIHRNKIKKIKLKNAILGLTRSRFEVQFENNNGKIKTRLIILSGSLTDRQDETKAIKIMREENLLNEK